MLFFASFSYACVLWDVVPWKVGEFNNLSVKLPPASWNLGGTIFSFSTDQVLRAYGLVNFISFWLWFCLLQVSFFFSISCDSLFAIIGCYMIGQTRLIQIELTNSISD